MFTTIEQWRIVYENSEAIEFGVPKEKLRRERRDSPKTSCWRRKNMQTYSEKPRWEVEGKDAERVGPNRGTLGGAQIYYRRNGRISSW